MGEGVRVEVHPDHLRAHGLPPGPHMIVVIDPARPMLPALDRDGRPIPLERTQPVCATCVRFNTGHRQHFSKAYHVQLESDGTAVVSPGVWDGLQRSPSNPFRPVNAVASPPTVVLHLPTVRLDLASDLVASTA